MPICSISQAWPSGAAPAGDSLAPLQPELLRDHTIDGVDAILEGVVKGPEQADVHVPGLERVTATCAFVCVSAARIPRLRSSGPLS